MNEEYKITNEYLAERGLDLNEYALNGAFIPVIIDRALELAITRCFFLNDDFNYEKDYTPFTELASKPQLLQAFYKLQFSIIYNLIFKGDDTPFDFVVDTIISHELHWGKINGFQKGIYFGGGR